MQLKLRKDYNSISAHYIKPSFKVSNYCILAINGSGTETTEYNPYLHILLKFCFNIILDFSATNSPEAPSQFHV